MLFRDWIRVEGLSYAEAARRCGLSTATMARRYALKGVVPRVATMPKIIAGTDGKVLPNDFFEVHDEVPGARCLANSGQKLDSGDPAADRVRGNER
jgi:hypothetical protein